MQGDGGMTYSGRALAVALDPGDPDVILVGAAQGGIWRSEDGGAHFVSVADDMPSQAVKVIRFAPSAPGVVYAGSGEPHSKTSIFGMGVFKSLDGGRTWDALPVSGAGWDFRFLSISGLQVDPEDPDTLYVSTANILGDRIDPFAPPPSMGLPGLFKSEDGGMTWTMKLQATDYRAYDYPAYDPFLASGYGFVDLELWRANSEVLFAVERSGGIYRSVDAGETWQLVTPVKNPGGGAAQGADFPAPVERFTVWDDTDAVFVSYPVLKRSATTPEFNRIEIGIGQFGGDLDGDPERAVIYAGYGAILLQDTNGNGVYDDGADLTSPVALIMKSEDSGATWRWLGDWMNGGAPAYCDAAASVNFENGLYDNTVEVNPEDPNDAVVGGNCNYNSHWPDPLVNPTRILQIPWMGIVFRTLDGGQSWMNISQACDSYVLDSSQPPLHGLPVYKCTRTPTNKTVHPDMHSAFFDTGRGRIYFTTDGGLWVCDIAGDGKDGLNDYDWTPLNEGLGTLQFFDVGVHPTAPDRLVGGMQDNANVYWNGSLWESWDWDQSDGTIGEYDPKDPKRIYLGWQYALARSDIGGGQPPVNWITLFDGAMPNGNAVPWRTLLEIDPVETQNVYVAGMTGVYRSADYGDHFSAMNPNPMDEVTAISVSPKKNHLVWVGTSTGKVYLFDTKKGKMWDKTGSNFPNRWVSSIEASGQSNKKAWVAFSGYDANSLDTQHGGNGNKGRVFRTSDQGNKWKDVSGNLTIANGLDIPICSLAVDPKKESQIWIGTDFGVYRTENGGQAWESYRGTMPVVAVMTLDCNHATGYLTCATFGRGVWRTAVK
jgi:photosystem II stability/assembly factor-like uncharacterized protein